MRLKELVLHPACCVSGWGGLLIGGQVDGRGVCGNKFFISASVGEVDSTHPVVVHS